LCSCKTSHELSKYDFIVEKSSAIDYAASIVRERQVFIRGSRVRKRSIYRSEIGLDSFSSFFERRLD
jgi:hypothetical protein